MGYKPIVIDGKKVCTECLQSKPLGEFSFRIAPQRHDSKCKECVRIRARFRYRANINGCRQRHIRQSCDYGRRVKQLVIEAYGSCCACCGETEPRFLTIDHIYGDGADSRRRGEGSGSPLYVRLRKEGFPNDRYQLLCFNCNCSKRQFGNCPHQESRHLAVRVTATNSHNVTL